MDEFSKVIREEIERQTKELPNMNLGPDDYAKMSKGIADLTKVVTDYEASRDNAEAEKAKVKRDTIVSSVTTGVSVGGLALGIAEFIKKQEWIKQGFIFEQTGSICSSTFKHIFTSIFKK